MKIERLPVGALECNCYFIQDEEKKTGIIVDPGDEGSFIINTVLKSGTFITHIVLTHGHFDHIQALNEIKTAFPTAKVCICRDEEAFLNDSRLNLSGHGSFNPVKADVLLKEGDSIPVGKYAFRILQTPGHSIGSICLHCAKEKVLISGDTLFYMGIGRCDLPTGNLKSEVESIIHKLFLLEDDTMVYPGHGRETNIGFEKKNNEVFYYQGRMD